MQWPSKCTSVHSKRNKWGKRNREHSPYEAEHGDDCQQRWEGVWHMVDIVQTYTPQITRTFGRMALGEYPLSLTLWYINLPRVDIFELSQNCRHYVTGINNVLWFCTLIFRMKRLLEDIHFYFLVWRLIWAPQRTCPYPLIDHGLSEIMYLRKSREVFSKRFFGWPYRTVEASVPNESLDQ